MSYLVVSASRARGGRCNKDEARPDAHIIRSDSDAHVRGFTTTPHPLPTDPQSKAETLRLARAVESAWRDSPQTETETLRARTPSPATLMGFGDVDPVSRARGSARGVKFVRRHRRGRPEGARDTAPRLTVAGGGAENTRDAIRTLDEAFPWLAGVEKAVR